MKKDQHEKDQQCEINEKSHFYYHAHTIVYQSSTFTWKIIYIYVCVEREREMVKREETINNNNNNRELQVAEQYYIYTDVRGACNYTYIYSSIYIFNILLYILPRNHEIITTKLKQWHLHR